MQPLPEVAAIVPAYNEAPRIGKVIEALIQVRWLTDIVVVDDGSRDGTAEAACKAGGGDPRLRVIRRKVNGGKGAAMTTGLEAIRAPLMLMVDADLIHLEPSHVEGLISPVLSGQADMTLGLFQGGYWRTDYAHRLTPWLTGQRCIRVNLLKDIHQEAAAGYGFETALTLAARHYRWRVQRVPLRGVTHVTGDIPRGSWRGPWNKVKMYLHILRAWHMAGYYRSFFPDLLRRSARTQEGDVLGQWWVRLKAALELFR